MKIAVIGAGIAGITAAYYLAKEGHEITVFDQEPYPAMRTSYANGGQLSVSNSEVWTTWKNVVKGIKWMLKKDAPLLIRPGLEIDKALWLARFLKHVAANDYAKNTAETIQIGLEARKLYEEIIAQEKINFDYSQCGILHIYKDREYFNAATEVKELYNANGCEWDILTEQEAKKLDPALENIRGMIGAVWTPSDSTGDIHKFCSELTKILETKYNVEFQFNYEVEHIDDIYIYDDFDKIVVANGVGAIKLSKQIGDRLPIYPVKGYSITVDLDSKSFNHAPNISLLDDQAKIVTARLGNKFRVAGTAELAGENYDIRRDRIDPLLNWVRQNFHDVSTENYSSWACLRPMTPNMLPIVKQSKYNKNIFYHTGHGHLGWTLSAATAKLLVNLIKGENK